MATLIFQKTPIVSFLTNKFINVPVILKHEDTNLIEIANKVGMGFTTEIPIYHSDEFEIKMKSCDVNIGVLTVPINIAQEITDKMIAGGIKAVWNFTPFRIRVPENIVVQNTSLYAHLAVMFNRLNVIQE